MKSSKQFLLQFLILSVPHLTTYALSTSKPCTESTSYDGLHSTLTQLSQRRHLQLSSPNPSHNVNTVIACILCFMVSFVSGSCGIGGGSLYIPILNLIAGIGLKSAIAFSSFMVTAGSLSSVLYTLLFVDKSLINYEIALHSEPCILLGVSIGFMWNIMFPQWLIIASLAIFLSFTTVQTICSGCKIWRQESKALASCEVEGRETEMGMPNQMEEREGKDGIATSCISWMNLLLLVMVWLCFFLLHALLQKNIGKVCKKSSIIKSSFL